MGGRTPSPLPPYAVWQHLLNAIRLTPHTSSLAPQALYLQVIANILSSTVVVFDICYEVAFALFRTLPSPSGSIQIDSKIPVFNMDRGGSVASGCFLG